MQRTLTLVLVLTIHAAVCLGDESRLDAALKVGARVEFGGVVGKVRQVIDGESMLVGIEDRNNNKNYFTYPILVMFKCKTVGIADGKLLHDWQEWETVFPRSVVKTMVGTSLSVGVLVKVTGTSTHKLVSGGTRTVYVIEGVDFGKEKELDKADAATLAKLRDAALKEIEATKKAMRDGGETTDLKNRLEDQGRQLAEIERRLEAPKAKQVADLKAEEERAGLRKAAAGMTLKQLEAILNTLERDGSTKREPGGYWAILTEEWQARAAVIAKEKKAIEDAKAAKKKADEEAARKPNTEKAAKAFLSYAKELVTKGQTEEARDRLRNIVKNYPETEAGTEARQLLEKLSK